MESSYRKIERGKSYFRQYDGIEDDEIYRWKYNLRHNNKKKLWYSY